MNNPKLNQIVERADRDGISLSAARLRIIDPLYSRLPRSLRRDKNSFIPRAPKRRI